jgi:very-short-patch-repair endonuclease
VVELDDPSHLLTAERDADRDALMATAGYTSLRYTAIPEARKVRADIEMVLAGITGAAGHTASA